MMKKAALAVSFLTLVCAAASVPAFAGTLYSNGAANDQFNALTINYGYMVSDSFTLSQASTITGANFDIWNYSGDSLTSVSWSIGTVQSTGATPETTDQTANTTDGFDFTNGYGFDVYTDSISIPSLTLGAGTYYFTLQNAATVNDNPAYWDMNNGSSIAYQNGQNQKGVNESGSNSETFSITGVPAAATPEPSSFLLLGSGLAGFAGLIRRKLKG